MGVKSRIREFVAENFYIPDVSVLTDEASLLEQGIIDSTGVLEVTAFLEKEFGIEVGDADIVPENLDTIGRIAAFVARKRGGARERESIAPLSAAPLA